MRATIGPGPLDASIYVEALRARPSYSVAFLLVVYAAVWTLTAWLADPAPDPKLAIGLALGREWRLGYVDGPPLAPWLLEGAYRVGGLFALYALGPLAVALAGWLVFALARRIVGDRHGALAVLLLVGVHPVAFPVGAFDSDLVQMPLVAGAILAWWRAIYENDRKAWLVLGVLLAALAYAGVQGLFVFATLVLLTLAGVAGRGALRSRDELVAVIAGLFVFTLLLTPRLIWLQDHDFAGVVPAADLRGEGAADDDAVGIAAFILIGHAGLFLLVVLASPLRAADRDIAPALMRPPLDGHRRTNAILLALLPPLTALAAAAWLGGSFPASAAAPLLLYSGLLVVALAGEAVRIHRQRAVAVAAASLLVLPPALELAASFASPWFGETGRATNWPAAEAARYVTQVYRTRTGRPLEYVIGDARTASAIALMSRDRPHVFIDADPARAPWADRKTVEAAGAVVVWLIEAADAAPPAALAARLPPLVAEAPLTLPWVRPGRLDYVRFGWAIIPPPQ